MKLFTNLLVLICILSSCHTAENDVIPTFINYQDLNVGTSRSDIYLPLIKDKRVGIVANHTSLVDEKHVVDLLLSLNVEVKKVFSPEHGFRGNVSDGGIINDHIDSITGLPIISLYGNHKKPSAVDLSDIDIVIFDLQDVGVRFYTYLSTLTYVMEACAENNIPLIVFDRPNPNGFYVDGPVLDPEFKSFVGMHPIPIVHGLTPGEFALMVNGEAWLANKLTCDLKIIEVENYTHKQTMDLPVKPSPNLPTQSSVLLYPSLALFEGTVVSVGRGTPTPFEIIGHPKFGNKSVSFTPVSIPGTSINPPLKNQKCYGIDLTNYPFKNSEMLGQIKLSWIIQFYEDLHDKTKFFSNYFEKLAGVTLLRQQIESGLSEQEIRKSWRKDLNRYKKIRAKYLLYPDFE